MNTLLILLSAFWQSIFPFPGPVGAPQIKLVNQTVGVGQNVSSFNVTIPAPTSGNTLWMLGGHPDNIGALLSSMSQANVVWTKINQSATNADSEMWCGDVSASAGTVVTLNLTTWNSPFSVNISEWQGTQVCANKFSGGSTTTAASGNPSTASITPPAGNTVVVLATTSKQGATFTSGPTNSYIALSTNNPNTMQAAYIIINSVSGTTSTGWTFSGGTGWDANISGIAH